VFGDCTNIDYSTYTDEEKTILKSNPYTLKVLDHQIHLTATFKKDFWVSYQAGNAPRKILKDFGYDVSLFTQSQVDGIVQHIRKKVIQGKELTEGTNRDRRFGIKPPECTEIPESMTQMQSEILYLRQEVEFLKKIITADNLKKKK